MTKRELISAVRAAVEDAENKRALELLIAFLEKDRRYRKLTRVARLTLAKQEKNTKDSNAGIISNEDASLAYNQVSETTLNLVEDLENERLDAERYEMPQQRFSKKLIGILPVTESFGRII